MKEPQYDSQSIHKFDRFETVNCVKVCSEPYSKPAETCRLYCLEERDEVLLKAVSVTDFKNMFQRTCKDTRLTLTDTVQLSFLSPTLEMVLFTETISEVTTQRSYEK